MNSNTAKPCTCCSLSRRCFISMSTLAMAAPVAMAAIRQPEDSGGLGEYIDLASFRPKPRVRILAAVARLKPPYWLGWPGTSYDLEKHRAEYSRLFDQYAQETGVELRQEADPLESDEAVAGFVKKIQTDKPDAVLVSLQHLNSWGWAETIAQAGCPTIVFSPIGTAFTGHVLKFSRQPGVHVISSLEAPAVKQAFRMVRAKRQFEETRLLVVSGDKRSDEVLEGLGTKVRRVPRNTLSDLFAKMPENDEVHEVANQFRRHAKKIVEPTRQDCLNSARSFLTAKRLLRDEECNAITTDCLGMVTDRVVPTPPCMGASLFQDAGVTYGCEADVGGALSLMLCSYLFDKPGFMQDPVPETVKNVLVAAHCVSGTRLNGLGEDQEPYILRSHSESGLGVSPQVLWKVGQPVTQVRFNGGKELIIDSGTVVGNVNTPPAGGCRTSVEIAMDKVEDVRDVRGFHQVDFYGNHRRDVEAFCQMYGIKAVHSHDQAAAEA
ncbi:MAG: hypothetical protein ACE15F_12175 [bacterium]